MADKKIIELVDGGAIQSGDYTIISRNMQDFKVDLNQLKDDTFTTGATLNGATATFNRNDGNTYNLDLTPLSATPVTSLSFSAITDTPTTILGYGISDAYTQTEIDTKILWEKGIGNLSVKTKGTWCAANNSYAVATGFYTTANGISSNAQNQSTTASGNYSNAAGLNTVASGIYAFSEGFETTASGIATHAAGLGTVAHDTAEFVIGKYNIPGTSTGATDSLFTVGNGVNIYSKSNAFQIKSDGTLILTQPSTASTDSYLTINASGVVTKKSFADNYNQLKLKNTYTISHSGGDFNNIKDAIVYIKNEFYGNTDGITLLLDSGDFFLDSPIIVNCTQNIALIGKGVNVTNIITEGVGIMFDCRSNINFEGINFIGDGAESDTCIKYSDSSHKEIKNCNFSNGFLNAIELNTGSLFIFNFVITDCAFGIYVNGDGEYNALDAEVGDITNCGVGIELYSGVNSIFNIHSVFFNPGDENCGIDYYPEHYIYYDHPSIQACHWNNTGKFFKGFDFTRHDGRDSNICIQSNVGAADLIPYAHLNMINNTTPTTLGNNTWTKLNYTGTGTTTTENKIYFTGNRFTYQPTNVRDLMVIGSGSITTSTQPAKVELVLVKNGNTALLTSPISITLDSNSKKFQWSANAYIPGVVAGDYFEIWGRGVGGNENIILEDLNLLINSQ